MQHKRISRIAAFLLVLVLALPAGCWDRREINDIAFVLGSAFDVEDEGYRATIQIVLPSQLGTGSSGGGGGTSGDKSYMIMSRTSDTIRMANFEEQQSLSRTLYFAHRRVILVGERAAYDGLKFFVDLLGRIPQNRLTALMITTHGEAHPYLQQKVDIETFPSEMLRELAINYMKQPTTIKDVISRMLDEGIDVVMPAVRFTDTAGGASGDSMKIVRMDGLALYRGYKLVRTVFGEEASFLMLAMNQANKPELVVEPPEGKGKLIFHLRNLDTKVKAVVAGKRDIRFVVTLTGKAGLAENASDYTIASIHSAPETERKLNVKIQEGVLTALQAAQKNRVDPVGFGRTLSNTKAAFWQQIHEQWNDLYPQCEIEVEARIRLDNTGTFVAPLGKMERGVEE